MKRLVKPFKIFFMTIIGLTVLIMVVLQLVLSEKYLSGVIDRLSSAMVDGKVSFVHVNASVVRSFPGLNLSLDKFSVTYPKGKFPGYEEHSRLLDAGSGEENDTLFTVDRLSLSLNYMSYLLKRSIDIRNMRVESPRIYAHKYNDTTANWNVFVKQFADTVSADDTQAPFLLPDISIGKIVLEKSPVVVYTAPCDEISALLAFRRLSLKGRVRGTGLPQIIASSNVSMQLDSLFASGRLSSDTLSLGVDKFSVELRKSHLDAFLSANAYSRSKAFGLLKVPLSLDSSLDFPEEGIDDELHVNIKKCALGIARIPLEVTGSACYLTDSTLFDIGLNIRDFKLHELYNEYAANFVSFADKINPESNLTFNATIKGWMVPACHKMPVVDATLKHLDLNVYGLGAKMKAACPDLLARDPRFDFDADVDLEIAKVLGYINGLDSLRASGRVCLRAKGNKVRLSQANLYNFSQADMEAECDIDSLRFAIPADTIAAEASHINLRLSSSYGMKGVGAYILADSLKVNADNLHVDIRGLEMSARNSEKSMSLDLHPLEASAHLQAAELVSGSERLYAENAKMSVSLERQDLSGPSSSFSSDFSDSPKDELASGDIDISLDKGISKYIKDWKTNGSFSLEHAELQTTKFPLSGTVSAVDCAFTENDLKINNFDANAGESNLNIRGHVSGLRRALIDRGLIRVRLDASSNRLNANELLGALNNDAPKMYSADTLAVKPVVKSALIVIPANLIVDADLNASNVKYSDLDVKNLRAKISGRGRCVRISDAKAETNMGNIDLDAFYYTKSKKNISAGFDLLLSDIYADQAIHLFPDVDSLLPMLKTFKGKMNLELAATSRLDTMMRIKYPSLSGVFKISGRELTLGDLGSLKKVTRLLLFRDNSRGYIEELDVCGIVADNELEVFPFMLNVDRYKIALRGLQSFTQGFNYHASIQKSPIPFKFGIDLYGDFDDFKYKFRNARYKFDTLPDYSAKVNELRTNLINSIRNVFDTGAEKAIKENIKGKEMIESARASIEAGLSESGELSTKEIQEIEKNEKD